MSRPRCFNCTNKELCPASDLFPGAARLALNRDGSLDYSYMQGDGNDNPAKTGQGHLTSEEVAAQHPELVQAISVCRHPKRSGVPIDGFLGRIGVEYKFCGATDDLFDALDANQVAKYFEGSDSVVDLE